MKKEYSKTKSRWYDDDPVLSKSVKILSESNDTTQIKIALNLIKVIIEHNIVDSNYVDVDDILTAVEDGCVVENSNRWYDINAALSTAINMLAASPKQVQKEVAKTMAFIVVNKMNKNSDETDE